MEHRYLINNVGIGLLWVSGCITVLSLLVIIVYILAQGLPVVTWGFLTQNPASHDRAGGIFATIVATVAVTLIAILVSTPISVAAAIYMAEYAGDSWLTNLVRFGADSLAGIPSIVFGLFGYIMFVHYAGWNYSLLAGGVTLALMALPIILRVSEEAIKVVPDSYKHGSLAMGASKWQTIWKVVLPTALPGIITGVILGMGRAVGETAAVLLTAGSWAKVPGSVFDPVRTMTVHIYTLATENLSMKNAYGTAAVLVIMVLAITLTSNYLTRRYIKKLGGSR
ncbi:MAG: phosphate transporter permease subunit PtsA [Methanocella sp. PtaU1.Bin125]|nr:MAG: phosphate transporter permease subunit PtsA [Methanocella sp. PtaU1.Bin125]